MPRGRAGYFSGIHVYDVDLSTIEQDFPFFLLHFEMIESLLRLPPKSWMIPYVIVATLEIS